MKKENNRSIIKWIIFIVIVSILASCATTNRSGCPDPARWERKNSFNK